MSFFSCCISKKGLKEPLFIEKNTHNKGPSDQKIELSLFHTPIEKPKLSPDEQNIINNNLKSAILPTRF